MKKLEAFLMTTFFVFGFLYIQAQNTLDVGNMKKDLSSTNWHLLTTTSMVNIYYQYVECGSIDYINFKLENTTMETKQVSWEYELKDNNSVIPQNPDDANVTIELGSFETIKGACLDESNAMLKIYIKEGSLANRLSNITLKNLTVTN